MRRATFVLCNALLSEQANLLSISTLSSIIKNKKISWPTHQQPFSKVSLAKKFQSHHPDLGSQRLQLYPLSVSYKTHTKRVTAGAAPHKLPNYERPTGFVTYPVFVTTRVCVDSGELKFLLVLLVLSATSWAWAKHSVASDKVTNWALNKNLANVNCTFGFSKLLLHNPRPIIIFITSLSSISYLFCAAAGPSTNRIQTVAQPSVVVPCNHREFHS